MQSTVRGQNFKDPILIKRHSPDQPAFLYAGRLIREQSININLTLNI